MLLLCTGRCYAAGMYKRSPERKRQRHQRAPTDTRNTAETHSGEVVDGPEAIVLCFSERQMVVTDEERIERGKGGGRGAG